VVTPIILTVVGLAVGVPAYLGLWRSWTGVDGNKAWALGFLWVGIGGALLLVGAFFPIGSAPNSSLSAIGAVIGILGMCSCYWMPPFLRPRWYRAQYTPLFRRRRT
jgi:hypothetical protein